MPELPEVETVARDLRGLVLDAEIATATVLWPGTVRTHAPDAIGAALAGRRIERVGRRGKQLVLRLTGDAVLTVHLKMTGQLFVVPRETSLDPYVRVVIAFSDGRDLRFRDIRKFGRIGLYALDPVTEEPVHELGGAAVFAGTGPEPLDDAFTVRAFRTRLRGRRGRLKPLLLDQSFVAGIGNIYADEALWASRLHPLRSAASLRPADERRLYLEVRRILAEAIVRRGSSIDDYTAPEGDGSMQEHLRVYQRAGEACLRCGRPVRRIVVGSRATHFCSWCQHLPATDRKGAAAIIRTMTPRPGSVPGPRGRRWSELDGDGALGRSEAERLASSERARTRADRTRRASATRRAAARGAGGGA
ncbi:MAG: bifunctional DNA-formamidopyrimidine glycosylase/DNA-(apurinic or apyrimidinic site) lyase [Chloroflexota bacterium]